MEKTLACQIDVPLDKTPFYRRCLQLLPIIIGIRNSIAVI
jgi:hypothetical protein